MEFETHGSGIAIEVEDIGVADEVDVTGEQFVFLKCADYRHATVFGLG